MENKVEVISCESGDWEVLKLNGKLIAEGHSLSTLDWIGLLKQVGIETGQQCISDEDMENGEY